MAKHQINPLGDHIVTSSDGIIEITRAQPHFRWLTLDGKLTFQQLEMHRTVTQDCWSGRWNTLWTHRK